MKTTRRAHQEEDFFRARDLPAFALWWEMGLGKTKEVLDVAAYRHSQQKNVDGLLVVARREVCGNWMGEEVPRHLDVPSVGTTYLGEETVRARVRNGIVLERHPGRLAILVISYDSVARTDRGYDLAKSFLLAHRTMMVLDESTAIKTPSSDVSRRCKLLGKLAHVRWILTGTAVAESPFDAYSQVQFLDPQFWKRHNLSTFAEFKAEFGVFEAGYGAGGRKFNDLKCYRQLERLHQILAPISSRRLKDDAGLDLPPKTYVTRMFDLAPVQRRVYDDLRQAYVAELDAQTTIEAPMAMVRLTRLQQVACGHVTVQRSTSPEANARITALVDQLTTQDAQLVLGDLLMEEGLPAPATTVLDGDKDAYTRAMAQDLGALRPDSLVMMTPGSPLVITRDADGTIGATAKVTEDVVPPGENPRLQLLLAVLEECAHHKVIVWCRFKRDVELVCDALEGSCVRYDGTTSDRDRRTALARFKDPADRSARVLVANTAAISMGVTLTIAKTMVYYSNSFSVEKRLQSEDRFHRIGQDQPVTIVDLVAADTVDDKIRRALREKFGVAAQVMGDRLREWLS